MNVREERVVVRRTDRERGWKKSTQDSSKSSSNGVDDQTALYFSKIMSHIFNTCLVIHFEQE